MRDMDKIQWRYGKSKVDFRNVLNFKEGGWY